MINAVLSVPRDDLYHALQMLLFASKGSNPPDLIVYSENNDLILRVGGMMFFNIENEPTLTLKMHPLGASITEK